MKKSNDECKAFNIVHQTSSQVIIPWFQTVLRGTKLHAKMWAARPQFSGHLRSGCRSGIIWGAPPTPPRPRSLTVKVPKESVRATGGQGFYRCGINVTVSRSSDCLFAAVRLFEALCAYEATPHRGSQAFFWTGDTAYWLQETAVCIQEGRETACLPRAS